MNKVESYEIPQEEGKEALQKEILDQQLSHLEKKIEVSPGAQKVLEIIQGTRMEQKIQEIEKNGTLEGFSLETFAEGINTSIITFLKQSFKNSVGEGTKLSDSCLDSLSVGIQFALMEELSKSGSQGVDFFKEFGNINIQDGQSAFQGLFSAFGSEGFLGKSLGKVGNINTFYNLANRVQNCVNYIALKSGPGKELGDGSASKTLMNPNEFRKLLSHSFRDENQGLATKSLQELGIEISEKNITDQEKNNGQENLREIANSSQLPITPQSLSAIQKSLSTAQAFLEKRSGYKESATNLMETVQNMLDINILGIGTLGALLGIQDPLDVLGKKEKREKSKFLNFIFTAMGFSGGLEGLHREYIVQNIEKNLHTHPQKDEKESLISDFLAFYQEEKEAKTPEVLVSEKFGLQSLNQEFLLKVPQDYILLKEALLSSCDKNEIFLNPSVLQSLGVSFSTKELVSDQGVAYEVIDETNFDKSQINDSFIEKYLDQYVISLARNQDFMQNIQSSDQFALALAGGLVAGQYFVEGVLLGLEDLPMYVKSPSLPDNAPDSPPEDIQTSPASLTDYVLSWITRGESNSQYDAVNPNDANDGVSLGILQWHKERAQNLMQKMQAKNPILFANIMGAEFQNLSDSSLWSEPREQEKINKFSLLMQEQDFKDIMDAQAKEDIDAYIVVAKDLGISDPAAIVIFCRIYNVGSSLAKNIIQALKEEQKSLSYENIYKQFQTTSYYQTYKGSIESHYNDLYAHVQTQDFSQMA